MVAKRQYQAVADFLFEAFAAPRTVRPETNDSDTSCEVIDRLVNGEWLVGLEESPVEGTLRAATPGELPALVEALAAAAEVGVHVLDWSGNGRSGRYALEAVVALGEEDDPAAVLIIDFSFESPDDGADGGRVAPDSDVRRLVGEARGVHSHDPAVVAGIADLGVSVLAPLIGDALFSCAEELQAERDEQAEWIAADKRYLDGLMRVPVEQLVAALENTSPQDPPYLAPGLDEIETVGDWLQSDSFSLLVTSVGDDPVKFLTAAAASMPDGERSRWAWAPRVWRIVMLGPVYGWMRRKIDDRLAVSGLDESELEEAWQRTVLGASAMTDGAKYIWATELTARQRAADLGLAAALLRHLADQVDVSHEYAALMAFEWESLSITQPAPLVTLVELGCGAPEDNVTSLEGE